MTRSTTDDEQARSFVARYRNLRAGESSSRWRELDAELRRIISSGQLSLLEALYERLRDEQDDPFALARQRAWRGIGLIRSPEAVRRFLDRTKAPPEAEMVRHEAQAMPNAPARTFGALLAFGQRDRQLDLAIACASEDPALLDLVACWIQERVVRGSGVGSNPAVGRFWRGLESDRHELARLPLELLPIEAGLVIESPRQFRFDTLGNWFAFAEPVCPSGSPVPNAVMPLTTAVDVPLTNPEREEIAAVWANPVLFPNGRWEARVFRLDRPPDPTELRYALETLPVECLRSGTVVRQYASSARQALNVLLCSATVGGAYATGRSAAYGRLLAWRSLAALTGARREDPFELVQRLADACSWVFFSSDSEWFDGVCQDVGLVCFRPDRSIAVFAATDSD